MTIFKNLYIYRELLKTNIKKEIRGKYKGSFLGVLWSFVNPLLMTLVYAIVFPFILKSKEENYLIFLVIGVLPWNFFTTVMNQGMICIRMNASIIKKVYFPREILPISVAVSGLINFFISCVIILLFVIFGGVGLSWHIIFLPFIAIMQFMLTLGLIFILCAVNVYIRDTEYIVNFFVMMLFYATPILYAPTMLPSSIRWILYLNPMTGIVNGYRDIFLYHQIPDIGIMGIVCLGSFLLMVLGYFCFKRLERGFAEEV